MSEDNDNDQADGNTKLATKPKTKIPSLYRVLMMNDDYTPMEFVIEVLEKFFQKNREEATQIMLHVHQRGVGICGIYTYDLAETKAMQVMNYASAKTPHVVQLIVLIPHPLFQQQTQWELLVSSGHMLQPMAHMTTICSKLHQDCQYLT